MSRVLPGAILAIALTLAFATDLPAASPAELTQLQQQYAFLVAERVDSPYDTGIEALNARFLTALTTAGEEARKAGRLPELEGGGLLVQPVFDTEAADVLEISQVA